VHLVLKWSRTILIWVLLVSVFSLYNFPANIIGHPIANQVFATNRVFYYNFSMTAASVVRDNFTLPFNLAETPDSYVFHVYTNISEQVNSVSALGQYVINWTLFGNGVKARNGAHAQVWSHTPYGLTDGGQIPDKYCCSLTDNFSLRQGSNMASLRFTLWSNLTQYGRGFYWIAWGPFVVELAGKSRSNVSGWALEIVGGALLFPVSHFIGLNTHKVGSRLRTKKAGSPGKRTELTIVTFSGFFKVAYP